MGTCVTVPSTSGRWSKTSLVNALIHGMEPTWVPTAGRTLTPVLKDGEACAARELAPRGIRKINASGVGMSSCSLDCSGERRNARPHYLVVYW